MWCALIGVCHSLKCLGLQNLIPKRFIDIQIPEFNVETTDGLGQSGCSLQFLHFGLIAYDKDLSVFFPLDFFQQEHFEDVVCNFVVLRFLGFSDVCEYFSDNAMCFGKEIGLNKSQSIVGKRENGVCSRGIPSWA